MRQDQSARPRGRSPATPAAGSAHRWADRARRRPGRRRAVAPVGERFAVDVGPRRPRRVLRGPAATTAAAAGRRLRAARPARRAGASSRSPRARSATGSCAGDAVEVVAASPDRVTPPCPLAGPATLRRLRLPARRAAGAAWAQGRGRRRAAAPARRPRRMPSRRCRRVAGDDGRPALAHADAVRRAARRPAGLRAHRSPRRRRRSTTA